MDGLLSTGKLLIAARISFVSCAVSKDYQIFTLKKY